MFKNSSSYLTLELTLKCDIFIVSLYRCKPPPLQTVILLSPHQKVTGLRISPPFRYIAVRTGLQRPRASTNTSGTLKINQTRKKFMDYTPVTEHSWLLMMRRSLTSKMSTKGGTGPKFLEPQVSHLILLT